MRSAYTIQIIHGLSINISITRSKHWARADPKPCCCSYKLQANAGREPKRGNCYLEITMVQDRDKPHATSIDTYRHPQTCATESENKVDLQTIPAPHEVLLDRGPASKAERSCQACPSKPKLRGWCRNQRRPRRSRRSFFQSSSKYQPPTGALRFPQFPWREAKAAWASWSAQVLVCGGVFTYPH